MTALSDKFLHSGTAPIRSGATEIEPLRDGIDYFKAVDAAISLTKGAGDAVYLLSWRFDHTFDLRVRPPSETAIPFYRLLVDKAIAKVDVRVILSTGAILGNPWIAQMKANPFGDNVLAAQAMRSVPGPGGGPPPLAGRVLLEWTGSPIGSHHMKSVVVVSGGGSRVDAFVAGIDPRKFRLDEAPHTNNWTDPKNGSPFGWHDMGIRLHGASAVDVWDVFRQRWADAQTQPESRHFVIVPLSVGPGPLPTPVPLPLGERINPPPIVPWSAPIPVITPVSAPDHDVQVLRSRFRWKFNSAIAKKVPWQATPGLTEGIYEVLDTYRKAIAAAEHYIYIEDQYLGEARFRGFTLTSTHEGGNFSLMNDLLSAAMKPGMKLIFVGSGRGDPDDPDPGPQNVTFPQAGDLDHEIAQPLQAAGVDPKERLAVWRLKPATVHSKVMIIDDRFLAIGSANLHRRSMCGEDSELHIAVVDRGALIRDFRIQLWSEHFSITSSITEMADWAKAVGLWRSSWVAGSGLWQSPGNPAGFAMAPHQLEFVGPK